MAEWWEEENLGEYFLESDSDVPLNDLLFGGELDVDMQAQNLFMEAFFKGTETNDLENGMHIRDSEAYVALVDYLWDVHGIAFEDAFSWEDFREWYG